VSAACESIRVIGRLAGSGVGSPFTVLGDRSGSVVLSPDRVAWCRTKDGWAVNLDGTNAALVFALPRIELRAGPRGWDCVCHLSNGTSLRVPVEHAHTIAAAMRAAGEGSLEVLGPEYERALRALLASPLGDRG
jgi:hypothetical protein